MNIKHLNSRIEIIEDFYLTGNDEDALRHFGLKGSIQYDRNGAPYNRNLLLSITDENDIRLILSKRKTADIYGVGIDLAARNRIKKHDFHKSSVFYPKELEQIDLEYANYLRILSVKEACFKAVSPLYRKERVSAGIFDFEISDKIKTHNRTFKVLEKNKAELFCQVIDEDGYVFVAAVCKRV